LLTELQTLIVLAKVNRKDKQQRILIIVTLPGIIFLQINCTPRTFQ